MWIQNPRKRLKHFNQNTSLMDAQAEFTKGMAEWGKHAAKCVSIALAEFHDICSFCG